MYNIYMNGYFITKTTVNLETVKKMEAAGFVLEIVR